MDAAEESRSWIEHYIKMEAAVNLRLFQKANIIHSYEYMTTFHLDRRSENFDYFQILLLLISLTIHLETFHFLHQVTRPYVRSFTSLKTGLVYSRALV